MSQALADERRATRRKLLRRFVVFPVVACVSVLIVLSIFENRLVYFPSGTDDWFEPADLVKEDVALTTTGGISIHAWWCPKSGADGALLFAHGNGGNLSHRADVYAKLRDALNVGVLAFDYPGYGRSGGCTGEQGCYDAATAAFDWLTGRGLKEERIILFGDSLGGGVATELATRRPCRALVLFSSFTSAPDVGHDHYPLLPVRLLMRNRFDNRRRLPNLKCPLFITHGDADRVIPVEHSRRLYEAAPEPKALHIDPGRGHETELTPGFLKALADFLARHQQ